MGRRRMSKCQHYYDTDDSIMEQPEGDDTYEVGYKKPPTANQFKPARLAIRAGGPRSGNLIQ